MEEPKFFKSASESVASCPLQLRRDDIHPSVCTAWHPPAPAPDEARPHLSSASAPTATGRWPRRGTAWWTGPCPPPPPAGCREQRFPCGQQMGWCSAPRRAQAGCSRRASSPPPSLPWPIPLAAAPRQGCWRCRASVIGGKIHSEDGYARGGRKGEPDGARGDHFKSESTCNRWCQYSSCPSCD